MFELALFAGMLVVGYAFGGYRERQHLADIAKREQQLAHIVVLAKSQVSGEGYQQATLVTGGVVIASDYFKQVASQVRSFFGGTMKAQENLLERARREAILRLKEQANAMGAKAVADLTLQSTFLDQNGVEILAVATALHS